MWEKGGDSMVQDYSTRTVIDQKGRLVIPSELRKICGIKGGESVNISFQMDGTLIIKPTNREG